MPQHFIKIEIKGESDLPKKETVRIAHLYKSDNITFLVFHNDQDDINYWMRNVDWYLLPVPEPQQPEQPESAETIINILKEYTKYLNKQIPNIYFEPTENVQNFITTQNISQSHNNTVVGPTEEQLMTYFNNHTSNVVNNGYVTLKAMVRSEFLDAIKWFRSHVREVELKTELVKLLTMLERNGGNNFIDKEKIVDDYLSARKEGENER